MIRKTANRMIKYGYRTHKVGRHVKRAGIVATGAGLAGLAVKGGSTYIATRGRFTGLPEEARNVTRAAVHYVEGRLPSQASSLLHHGRTALATKAKQWARRVGAKGVGRAERLATLATKMKLGTRSYKLGKIGLVGIAGGIAISKLGSMLLKAGYGAHPGGFIKRQLRRAKWHARQLW